MRLLGFAIATTLMLTSPASAQQATEIRQTVDASNFDAFFQRLARAAQTGEVLSLDVTIGSWSGDFRAEYFPRFGNLDVSNGNTSVSFLAGTEYVNEQNVVRGAFRIEGSRSGSIDFLTAELVTPRAEAASAQAPQLDPRQAGNPGPASGLAMASNDPTMLIDETARLAVADSLASYGVESDFDGTSVHIARGARRTAIDLGNGELVGTGYCAIVAVVTSNGTELGSIPFFLFQQRMLLVRDPNPANEQWDDFWTAFSINDIQDPVRQRIVAECQRPAD